MKIQDITKEQIAQVAESYGVDLTKDPTIVERTEAKALEYKVRPILGVPFGRYEAASDVSGAFAWGVEVGLKLAQLSSPVVDDQAVS